MTAKDIKNMKFEDALGELEKIVDGFESGQVNLEDAIEQYAKGAELKKHCEKKLSEARLKVEKISISKSGDLSIAPFEG